MPFGWRGKCMKRKVNKQAKWSNKVTSNRTETFFSHGSPCLKLFKRTSEGITRNH